MPPRLRFLFQAAFSALAVCGGLLLSACGQDPNDVTSSDELAEIEGALSIYADLSRSVIETSKACELKVNAGQYSIYEECWAAEIRGPLDQSEDETRATLARIAPKTSDACAQGIAQVLDAEWGGLTPGPGWQITDYGKPGFEGAKVLLPCDES